MSKKRKVAIRLIAVFIAAIILGSAVRVGMYYFEYRQDSKILYYLKENESKSVFRGLVNDDGKPYQQKTVRYDIDGDGKKEIVYAGYDELGSGYPRYVICSIGIHSSQKFYVKAIYDLTCFDYTVAPDKAKYVLQHGIPSMAIKSGKLLFQVHDYDDKDKILNTFTMTGQQGDHLVFNTESGRFVTSDWEDFDKEDSYEEKNCRNCVCSMFGSFGSSVGIVGSTYNGASGFCNTNKGNVLSRSNSISAEGSYTKTRSD
mgnify:FL=1